MNNDPHQVPTTIVMSGPLDLQIAGWLHEKTTLKSGSPKTGKAYATTIYQFRSMLQQVGLDLDALSTDEYQPGLTFRQAITLKAQEFATSSLVVGRKVKETTINQRLAILSSFYEYALRNDHLFYNPIKKMQRATVHHYKSSKAIPQDRTEQAFEEIDTTTLRGKRDYALLSVLLSTGRRLSEVATLQVGNLEINRHTNIVTVHFEHAKGGKNFTDILPGGSSPALLDWLQHYYNVTARQLTTLPGTTPLWVSLAAGGRKGRSYGDPLSIRSISNICEKYLGTGKVHATRHTWTTNMLKEGAPLPLIKNKLGHSSLATTGIYAESLEQSENPYAEKVAQRAGITSKKRGHGTAE